LTQLDATSAVAIELGLAGHAGACNCGGFPAGYEASAWYGIAAPAGTPAAIVERYPESDSGSGPAAQSATAKTLNLARPITRPTFLSFFMDQLNSVPGTEIFPTGNPIVGFRGDCVAKLFCPSDDLLSLADEVIEQQ
jgi:hypothetical protein